MCKNVFPAQFFFSHNFKTFCRLQTLPERSSFHHRIFCGIMYRANITYTVITVCYGINLTFSKLGNAEDTLLYPGFELLAIDVPNIQNMKYKKNF